MLTIGFGGGCHWCTEAVFQSLKGIADVRQGFIRSDPPDDRFSEAVEVTFDPECVSLPALVRVHLATHASASDHKLRGKYRSAIYVLDMATREVVADTLGQASRETGVEFVTRPLLHRGFKASDERFQNYRANNPERPFCKTYIDPKLSKLRREFATLLKTNEDAL